MECFCIQGYVDKTVWKFTVNTLGIETVSKLLTSQSHIVNEIHHRDNLTTQLMQLSTYQPQSVREPAQWLRHLCGTLSNSTTVFAPIQQQCTTSSKFHSSLWKQQWILYYGCVSLFWRKVPKSTHIRLNTSGCRKKKKWINEKMKRPWHQSSLIFFLLKCDVSGMRPSSDVKH